MTVETRVCLLTICIRRNANGAMQCKWRNASGLGLGGLGLGLGFAICVAPLALRHLRCAVCIAPNTESPFIRCPKVEIGGDEF